MSFVRTLPFNIAHRPILSLDDVHRLAPSVFATEPHREVSNKYQFIPTINMVESLMREGWQPVQASQHLVRKAGKVGYQKHLVRFRNPNLAKIGDREIDLLVYNSHDRTSGFKFLAGLYEFVCANGLVVGDELCEPISVRHVGYKAQDAIEASFRVIDSIPRISQSIEAMRSISLDPDERRIFAESALIAKYGNQTDSTGKFIHPITPERALQPRRSEDVGNSLWKTMNVVQENLVRGNQRGIMRTATGEMRRTTTRGVSSPSRDTKLNQALWSLAENMKAIKSAA